MKQLILIAALFIVTTAQVQAQTTRVTGTVTDPNGNDYANGTVSAFLILPSGAPIPPGARLSSGPFFLNPAGIFSISLPSPLTYTFAFCGTPVNIGPRGNPTPNSVCFPVPTPINISGRSQDITIQITAAPPAVLGTGSISGGTIPFVGVPTGTCTAPQTAVDTTTGNFYSCLGGVWHLVTGVLSSPVTSPNPLALDVNAAFKGPNLYIDATRFGVRAVVPGLAPQAPGITVNCFSGSPNVTISSASTFQNGDGVALYGCGPGTIAAPSAPTVTPSVAAAQTGTLIDVNGPTGATTYCYQLVARSLMGATNVSPETCTATGPASLGLQTNTITSATLSNTTATYTTSASHGLVVGAHVVVVNMTTNTAGGQPNGISVNIPFNGWFTVATVPDNVHFTVNLLTDSRNGAITAGAGGTVNYWNSIHIKATETTNNYIYYLYGRVTGGTKVLIGAMWPQDINLIGRLTDLTYLVFDDFGPTVTTFPSPPYFIPTTVPTTPTNDMLATTVVSGAGTTSLTLANSAGNTNTNQTILFDDAVTFLNAATYAANIAGGTNGPLLLPEPGSNDTSLCYLFNSPITLGTGATSRLAVMQKGTVRLNEPMLMSIVNWVGQTDSNNTLPSFANTITPVIQIGNASPGIFGLSANFLWGIAFSMLGANGATAMVQDAGGIPSAGSFRDISFNTGTVITYSNMALMVRGSGAGYDFRDFTMNGSQNGNLTATTPGLYFNGIGNSVFKNISLSGIGIAQRVNPAGSFVVADAVYCQGCYEPYFSVVRAPSESITGYYLAVRNVVFDTHSLPLVADYGGHALTLDLENSIPTQNNPHITGSFPPGSSPRMNVIMTGSTNTPVNFGVSSINTSRLTTDGVFGRGEIPVDIHNKSMAFGPAFSLFTTTGPYPPPTCHVSAGGSVPVGTNFYFYVPIFNANGSEGANSTLCVATTTPGNQTVTLNWSSVPGVTQYNVYRGPTQSNIGGLNCSPITGTTLVDTAALNCGFGGTEGPAGGPAGMRGGLVWATTMQVGTTTFATLGTPNDGTFTYCPDCIIANPCAGGGTGALAKRLNGIWVCN